MGAANSEWIPSPGSYGLALGISIRCIYAFILLLSSAYVLSVAYGSSSPFHISEHWIIFNCFSVLFKIHWTHCSLCVCVDAGGIGIAIAINRNGIHFAQKHKFHIITAWIGVVPALECTVRGSNNKYLWSFWAIPPPSCDAMLSSY